MNLLIRESVLQRIVRKTGHKPCQCKCSLCKEQCHTPCLGTPEDIERLIDAGYNDKLKLTCWAAGILLGVIDKPIPMIQPIAGNEYCIFFHNGLCDLHDKGLKPTEGKLSHHSASLSNFKASKSIAWNVAKEWIDESNMETIERVIRKFIDNGGNKEIQL